MTSTVDPEARPGDEGEGGGAPPHRHRRRLLRREAPLAASDAGSSGDGPDDDLDGADDDPGPRRRRRRWAPWWLRLLVRVTLAVVLVAVLYLAVTFVQVWDASRSDEARPSEAIVVLGAAQYDCEPSPVLEGRLDHARELYADGIAPRIVVTGGKRAGDRCTEAEASANYLHGLGVPDEDIVREVQGRNSWESLAASARILGDEGWNEVVLVTSGYHALRVRAIADELGLDAVVSPVHDSSTSRDLLEETGIVAVGRVVGFRRLVDIDDRLVNSTGSGG